VADNFFHGLEFEAEAVEHFYETSLRCCFSLHSDHCLCVPLPAGRLWGHQLYGVEPDMMTLAKPLAGGLPIGAVLLKQHVADALKPGELAALTPAVLCCVRGLERAVVTLASCPRRR
jgi:hypothetical protein